MLWSGLGGATTVMAGRGRRMMSFSMDTVGINRGESLPAAMQQPTPVFPMMEHKPLPLAIGEEAEYLLALKQEFRGAMRSLPCFIQAAATCRDVERYSDKYHSSEHGDTLMDWTPDWRRLPKELQIIRRPHRNGVSINRTVPSGQKHCVKEKDEVLLKLESLEHKEQQEGEAEEKEEEEEGEEKRKKQEEEDEAEVEEEYDEEEFEEETDYIMSYFDNGEEFGGDSDDNMDEAIY